jgi:uncharacterized membrane protein
MSPRLLSLTTLGGALGCGLVAGFLFAFSCVVMPALARLPPPQGIAAMQSINIVVINRWFLAVFLGTAAACGVLVVVSVLRWNDPGAWLRLGGALLYLVGTIALTRLYHIPRNDVLATLDPGSADAAVWWARYVASWTTWNHVRTLAALLAAAALTWSMKLRA